MAEAVCLGETMAMLTPSAGEPLGRTRELQVSVGGAESNVALGLAALGVPTAWVSRLGDDAFGERIRKALADGGVDVSHVELDPARRTGLYLKDPAAEDTAKMVYYRAGSAASAMSPGFLDRAGIREALGEARLIHLSGITPALSDDCHAMVESLLADRPGDGLVSFDVNWRPALWEDHGDAAGLAALANRADIVLVGRDEAETAFGVRTEEELRALLPDPAVLVVKNDSTSAVALAADGTRTEVPALRVDVVESVGAGDAFASGYLAEVLRGADQRSALRHGHVSAACTLTVRTDRGPLPPAGVLERVLAAPDEHWSAIRVSAAGFELPGPGAGEGSEATGPVAGAVGPDPACESGPHE
ncbi:sugar kinase [Zhihengliuella sp.]|uniref:sugar kinase n=1 Tax=Zhihengliuella sp. TaxID=1954483 RepID=UPI0028119D12|nr:sugar kinase [Zhihengliuella sp.]